MRMYLDATSCRSTLVQTSVGIWLRIFSPSDPARADMRLLVTGSTAFTGGAALACVLLDPALEGWGARTLLPGKGVPNGRRAGAKVINMTRYLVVIEETDTGYSAYSPDMAGCVSSGATRKDVKRNMRRAI